MSSDIKHTCGNLAFDWTCKACIAGLENEDFFAPPVEQRTLVQAAEETMGGLFVEDMPRPAAPALYTPNGVRPTNPGGPGDDEYRRLAAESIASMVRRGERK